MEIRDAFEIFKDDIDFISYKQGCGGAFITHLITNQYDEYKNTWGKHNPKNNSLVVERNQWFGSEVMRELSVAMFQWWVGEYEPSLHNTSDYHCRIENILKERHNLPKLLTSWDQLSTGIDWNMLADHLRNHMDHRMLICIEHPFTGITDFFPNAKKIAVIPKRNVYWSNYAYTVAGHNNFLLHFPKDWDLKQYLQEQIKDSIIPNHLEHVDKLMKWLRGVYRNDLLKGTIHFGQYYNGLEYNVNEVNDKDFLYQKLIYERNIATDKSRVEHFREYTIEGFQTVSVDDAIHTTKIPDILGLEPTKYVEGITNWHNKNLELCHKWI